jgi:hypothetical protein
MAKIEGQGTLEVEVVVVLSEEEAGALDALAGYGADAFLKVFYEKLGRAYLEPYERGLRSLFDSVKNGPVNVSSVLDRAEKARHAFYLEDR